MAHLRQLFESLGFSSVETFIASGNVIFETPAQDTAALEKQIEAHLQSSLGYEVATFLRTPAELADIASYEPFAAQGLDAGEGSLYIAFTRATPDDEAQQRLLAFRTETDDPHVRGREIYWLCRTSAHQSAFSGAVLERAIGMPATIRNSTTVRKLAERHPAHRAEPHMR